MKTGKTYTAQTRDQYMPSATSRRACQSSSYRAVSCAAPMPRAHRPKRKTVEVPFEHDVEPQRDSHKAAEKRRRLLSQLPVRICVFASQLSKIPVNETIDGGSTDKRDQKWVGK
jgi:hypothetical protein